jgi:serine phosphatase RsbU (regulator of sigma subunit)
MAIDLIKIYGLESLNDEEKLKRRILLRIILLTVGFGFAWSIFYYFLGYTLPALVPFLYGLFSIGNLIQYYLFGGYSPFRLTQLILILLLPFFMQISFGAFPSASAVVLASVLCPMGALMFHNARSARIFFGFFVLLVIIAGFYAAFGPLLVQGMNESISIAFFVLNIVVICTIIYVLLEYFVDKKDHMQNLLLQKNKDITDSITYAKRIQQAILPPEKMVKELLPDSFIFYKPKDIVSGDFYWVAELGNMVMFAAVDCTGHGVPGAFMSIVGQNFLNQAVNEHRLSRPDQILNFLNEEISRNLGKDEKHQIKDGMDLALCVMSKTSRTLEFAGAFNPLWILRGDEIIEVKGNKFPIGSHLGGELKSFTKQEVKLEKGDQLYVFTDGYADQFGGPKQKKFKYKNIKKLLIDNRTASMERQKQILENTLADWKGNLEQIDDILIMGVRIS